MEGIIIRVPICSEGNNLIGILDTIIEKGLGINLADSIEITIIEIFKY